MSISSTGSSSVNSDNGLSSLVKQLVNQIDTNSDGQISSAEFGSFLTKLIGAASSTNATARAKATADAGSATTMDSPGDAPVATAPVDVLPSTWTDNNAPYGVTFAGFSPQDHTNLTLDDLKNPQNAKYAAYEYLVANKIDPSGSNWAQAAADGLNQKFGTTIFHAIDAETLGYGDEFIHTAPNGYGMARGTYNANATGEFFWGAA